MFLFKLKKKKITHIINFVCFIWFHIIHVTHTTHLHAYIMNSINNNFSRGVIRRKTFSIFFNISIKLLFLTLLVLNECSNITV